MEASKPLASPHAFPPPNPLMISVLVPKVKRTISSIQFLSKIGIKSNKGPNFFVIPPFTAQTPQRG